MAAAAGGRAGSGARGLAASDEGVEGEEGEDGAGVPPSRATRAVECTGKVVTWLLVDPVGEESGLALSDTCRLLQMLAARCCASGSAAAGAVPRQVRRERFTVYVLGFKV